jgi:hypothetical protein
MGFKGIVVSDALNMKSVSDLFPEPGQLEWEAFNAGNDLLCFSENVEEGIEMILKKGSEQMILESVEKLIQFKEKLGIDAGHLPKEIEFDWSGHDVSMTSSPSTISQIFPGKNPGEFFLLQIPVLRRFQFFSQRKIPFFYRTR